MDKLKVVKVTSDDITFDNGTKLYSEHIQDCCENHYLDFSDLTLNDFEELEFDLTTDNFFNRIEDYGIELIPILGHPIRIPGYGYNNGYYSSNLNLVISGVGVEKTYPINECQSINE